MSVEIIGCACLKKHCAPGVCDIYDSICQFPTHLRQVAAIQKCSDASFKMRHINVQMQAGADLFSIAFATALCAGKDPHKCLFQQSEIRSQLKLCFERGELAMFQQRQNRDDVLAASKLQKILKSTSHAAYLGTGTPVCLGTLHSVPNAETGFTKDA